MRLHDLHAIPHPDGHRIDLAWVNPEPAAFPGVRVVRREGTHPVGPDDGVIVAHGALVAIEPEDGGIAVHRVRDTGLRSHTVYYYALFPYRGDPPEFSIDRANRATALATGKHDSAGRMYQLLPAIYHRYDAEDGSLRRMLELPGGELDLIRSQARTVLDSHDPEHVDGRTLPLLADWIGWKTDFRLELEKQRNEIRGAPAIYRRIGLLAVVGATIKRISGWETRSKEFVHNVVRSNRPPRLNLWARRIAADGTSVVPDAPPDASPDTLLSLDDAYTGRPAVAVDDHGVQWLFYATVRRDRWRIGYKTSPTFTLGVDALASLEADDVVRLQEAFAAVGVPLAADAVIAPAGSLWHVEDATLAQRYVIEPAGDGVVVYHISADPLTPAASASLLSPSLAPSRLFAAEDAAGGGEVDERDPAAALQGETLWLFWSTHEREAGRWELRYRTRRDGEWSEPRRLSWNGDTDPAPERRAPAAVVDHDDALWLFWLEQTGRRWVLRYNRHDGTDLETDPDAGWELDTPAPFPVDGVDLPGVESDVFALAHPDDDDHRLWVFWARKEATGEPGQTRWSVAYRSKEGVDIGAADWSAIATVPKVDALAHDREPAARVDGDGNLTVFWSSDRDGGWSIWRATLDLAETPPAWGELARVTDSPYAQRDPLPIALDEDTLLVYRSNESLPYSSDVYRATRTVDFRYAGSTTAHIRDAPRLGLRGEFDDFQRYTFDTGTGDGSWYRRDTIGVYVQPDTMDEDAIGRGIERIARVLPEFMPTTDRAVFIPTRDLHVDHVYTYDAPGLEPRRIGESHADDLDVADEVPVLGPDADFGDDFE